MEAVDKGAMDWRVNWSDTAAGLVGGAVALAYALSYAALLFPGNLHHLLPVGLALALLSAGIGAIWLAARSEMPFAVSGPDGNTTSILVGMVATMAGAAPSTAQAKNVLVLLAVATLFCAALFVTLGVARLGSAARFVPYPVIGGFLASTGYLIAIGGLRVVWQAPFDASGLTAVFAAVHDPLAAATMVLALLFYVLFQRLRHPGIVPIVLVATGIAVVVALHLAGMDIDRARLRGWVFDVPAQVEWMPLWALGDGAVQWRLLADQWLDVLAVAAVAVITLLLSSSGLELMSRRDISVDHELREHGWMNLAVVAAGGYLSIVSVSRSSVLLHSGARTRLAGIVAGLFCLGAIGGAPLLLGWVARPVIAAFLIYLGLALLKEWVVDARHRFDLSDWSLVIVILVTTATIGFTVAVVAGVLVSCLNFALSYSRLGVVQHDLDGTGTRSSVQRPAAQRQVLAEHGAAIRVVVLRGVLFFGTASAVLDRVRSFLQPGGATDRVLVLDFSQVDSADSSAALTFTKIAQLAADRGVRLQLCGLGSGTRAALAQTLALPTVLERPTLDVALDEAEERLLVSHGHDPDATGETFDHWMVRELGGEAAWATLRPLLVRRELGAGELLMRQGSASAEGLYLIESGRLDVTLPAAGASQRLASLMGGTMVGEMALYDSAARSADVSAERHSVVWSLSREALERLQAQAPTIALQVHALVVRTLAERLRLANTAASALKRGSARRKD